MLIPDTNSWNFPAPHTDRAAIPKPIPKNLLAIMRPETVPSSVFGALLIAARVIGAINNPNPNPASPR